MRWLVGVGLLSGCFAEISTTYAPRARQTLTAQDGTTTNTTEAAWSLGLWLGFHVDFAGFVFDYAPPGGGGRGLYHDKGQNFGDDGHHFRGEVDVTIRRHLKWGAVFGYDTIRHLNVDRRTPSASGGTFTGGLSIASLRRTFEFSLGGSYYNAKSAGLLESENGMPIYTPGIDESATGAWFSFRIAAPRMADALLILNVDWPKMQSTPLEYRAFEVQSGSRANHDSCVGGYMDRDDYGNPEYQCP